MYCKDNIIDLHRIDSAGVNGKVLVLDDGREKEPKVEGRVAQEPSNVQDEKIKIEAYDTSSPEVEEHLQKGEHFYICTCVHTDTNRLCCSTPMHPWDVHYLRVEGDGPGNKVYPSNHYNDDVEGQHVNNISWSHDVTNTVGTRCLV